MSRSASRSPLRGALRATGLLALALGVLDAPLARAAPTATSAAVLPPSPAAMSSPSSLVRPKAEAIRAAYERHDSVELERLARRLGAPRLCALVERGSRTREAALAALPLVDDGLLVLPRLAALADRPETPAELALALVVASRQIAERAARGELDLDELPGDVLRSAVDSLATLAGREERPLAARVAAVETLAALVPLVTNAPLRLAALVATPEPTLRRAIADALPASLTPVLVQLLSEDATPGVAATAGAVLCREVPPAGAQRKTDHVLRRALELPPEARQRLRSLASDDHVEEGTRLDLLPCLRAGAQRQEEQQADFAVLQSLARGPEGGLKRRARALGGR